MPRTSKRKIQTIRKYVFSHDASELLLSLFADKKDYDVFLNRHNKMSVAKIKLENIKGELFLGVDAGSTITKAVLINQDKYTLTTIQTTAILYNP
ncbi:MAG: hypothetical protein LE178_04235 [Endomicrobium sp.]|nr:hypothetical protein [Endomicrobium sp.]